MFYFEQVDHALAWSTEVLRTRRFAKISPFYKESVSEGWDTSLVVQKGEKGFLPDDPDEKYSLAIKVDGLLGKLPEHEHQLLKFYYWGDYVSEAMMKKAARDMLALRSKGIRTHMHYRYSFRHLGRFFNIDHKTAAKRVRSAQESMQDLLMKHGLIIESGRRSSRMGVNSTAQ